MLAYVKKLVRAISSSVSKVVADVDWHPMGVGCTFICVFWTFWPYIRAFQTFLRPILTVDGTFLKGAYEGSLLIACADDEENGTILIAYVMAEVVCESSRLLDLIRCHDWNEQFTMKTIISDRMQWISSTVTSIFLKATHGYCRRYPTENL